MSAAFDPHTADDPFERRIPTLPDKATDRERELAAKYTRISFVLHNDEDDPESVVEDATLAWLVVDEQSWRITARYCDTREEASRHCWMLAKALAKLIDAERHKWRLK